MFPWRPALSGALLLDPLLVLYDLSIFFDVFFNFIYSYHLQIFLLFPFFSFFFLCKDLSCDFALLGPKGALLLVAHCSSTLCSKFFFNLFDVFLLFIYSFHLEIMFCINVLIFAFFDKNLCGGGAILVPSDALLSVAHCSSTLCSSCTKVFSSPI